MSTHDRPAATAAPVCVRHPDRVSYTTCQRCERPACPECQVPAAVGFQCVDCVREQKRRAPAARTLVGSRMTSGRPVVTYAVLGLLVAVYVGQWVSDEVTTRLAFAPFLSEAEPWRFLTVALVHARDFPLHILLNGFMLWQVGRETEAVLGRWRYVAVLVLSTLAGSVAILWLTPPDPQSGWFGLTVGISGAVFGLFGAALAVEASQRRPVGRQLATIAFFALLGVVVPSISWQGHIGGLVGGLLAGAALARAPRSRRLAWQVAGLAAIVVLLAVLVAVRWAGTGGCLAEPVPGGYSVPSCG